MDGTTGSLTCQYDVMESPLNRNKTLLSDAILMDRGHCTRFLQLTELKRALQPRQEAILVRFGLNKHSQWTGPPSDAVKMSMYREMRISEASISFRYVLAYVVISPGHSSSTSDLAVCLNVFYPISQHTLCNTYTYTGNSVWLGSVNLEQSHTFKVVRSTD